MPPPSNREIIAVFDFDGTVTYCDTFFPFLRETAGSFKFWMGLVFLFPILALHFVKILSNEKAKIACLRWMIRGKSSDELANAVQRFVHARLPRLIHPEAMQRLRWHQQNQHRIIVLSASPENYLIVWAATERIADVIATRLEYHGGAFTGGLVGSNCHGLEKVDRLTKYLGDPSQFEIYSYGDSESDKPVLAMAEHRFFRSFQQPGWMAECRRLRLFLKAL